MDNQPAVTFYAPGEPLVTVCSGAVRRCRMVLGTSRDLRSGRVDDVAFVMALGQSEDPTSTAALSAEGRSFWEGVAMTTSTPGWLVDDDS